MSKRRIQHYRLTTNGWLDQGPCFGYVGLIKDGKVQMFGWPPYGKMVDISASEPVKRTWPWWVEATLRACDEAYKAHKQASGA